MVDEIVLCCPFEAGSAKLDVDGLAGIGYTAWRMRSQWRTRLEVEYDRIPNPLDYDERH